MTETTESTAIEIKNRWTGEVILRVNAPSQREAIISAVKDGADLRSADLRSADLCGANLRSADLCGADLYGANLRGANLRGANLRSANLRSADLSGADLCSADLCSADLRSADLCSADLYGADLCSADLYGADLCGADLCSADLCSADLCGANLYGADLCSADLYGANLYTIRDDFWAVLSAAPSEVLALRQALIDGRVDGSTYSGDCACLVGTIANAAGCSHEELEFLKPNAKRPAERFFLGIDKGDTPETNQISKLVLEWLDQWLANIAAAVKSGAVHA